MKFKYEETKKEHMKHNEIQDGLMKGISYVAAHKENTLITLAVIVVGVFLASTYIQRRAANAEKAQDLLTTGDYYTRQPVIKTMGSTNFQNFSGFFSSEEQKFKKAQEVYQQVLTLYPNSSAAGDAMFKIGTCYFGVKQYDKAMQTYQGYLTDYPNGKFTAQSQLGIGYSLEEQKQFDKALQNYQKVAEIFKGSLWSEEALYHQGLCYEAKKDTKKAQQCFKQILDSAPTSYWGKLASEKLAG